MHRLFIRPICGALFGSVVLGSIGACVPLAIGGATATGVVVASDRRTAGFLVEDNSIQIKAESQLRQNFGDRAHINVTSYNRLVLLTGEVPSSQDKLVAERIARNVENVERVVNEIAVLGNSTLSQRSADVLVTSKVKASLVDARDLTVNAFKIVTERGIVYVLGKVTQREANRMTEIVTTIPGVQRLVRVLDIVSENELAGNREAIKPSPAPNSN